MTFEEFEKAIIEAGGTKIDAVLLDLAGAESAHDAHYDDFKNGEIWFDGFSDNDFTEFCKFIGREFVLDNLGEIFFLCEKIEEV